MHKIINKHKELVGEWSTWKDEVEYITEIISHINTPEDYTFIIGIHNEPLGDVPKGSIVFSTSDEHSNQPIPNHLQENVFLLFKNYYPKEPVSDNRVFTFPLGYLTGFNGTSSVPFNEREFDYSFSGTFNGNGREKLHQQLDVRRNDGRKKFWAFTQSWGKGLSMDDYSKLLSQTKIALCPSGYVSKESFRIFEAARCGCVLIVDDVPTDMWYYDGFPGIIVKDWSDLSAIERLLSDTEMMQHIGNKTVEWYDRCVSPKSVAAYVQEKINNRKKETNGN